MAQKPLPDYSATLYNCVFRHQRPDFSQYDALEVHGCCRVYAAGERDNFAWEQCEDAEAEIFSVYGHLPVGGIRCITDCDSKEIAIAVARLFEGAYPHLTRIYGAMPAGGS